MARIAGPGKRGMIHIHLRPAARYVAVFAGGSAWDMRGRARDRGTTVMTGMAGGRKRSVVYCRVCPGSRRMTLITHIAAGNMR